MFGNSSNDVLRKKRPTFVTRGSFSIFGNISSLVLRFLISFLYKRSASIHPYPSPVENCVYILRNFTKLNGFPFLQILFWTKNTGPRESINIAIATKKKIGDSITIASVADTKSKRRFRTRNHPSRGDGLYSNATIGPKRELVDTKSSKK